MIKIIKNWNQNKLLLKKPKMTHTQIITWEKMLKNANFIVQKEPIDINDVNTDNIFE